MIRIDEIYENTFFAWLKKYRRGVRSFHCFPIGSSRPETVICQGTQEVWEHNYITFFDVEPIHLDKFLPTFDLIRNELAIDIHARVNSDTVGTIVTSEHNSENVEQLCSMYDWQSRYYFFWGWAALDWYRGYDQTFLMTPPAQRNIRKTFISPNRIVGGARRHRVELLYYIFKRGLTNNWISCPAICPTEDISIIDIVRPLADRYPDIELVFTNQPLPLNMPGETGHPMHSCWLSLFDQCSDSMLYLVSETVATKRRHHLTEKIFKPICLQMPFVLHSTHGSLEHLRSYGFQTFGDLWDESYDNEPDDTVRIKKIADLLTELDQFDVEQKQQLFDRAQTICEHNYQHFYGGGFQAVLWKELTDMLESIDSYRPPYLDDE
jgi:hypothetical protein